MQTGQSPQADGTYAIYKTHARNKIAAGLIPLGKSEEATIIPTAATADVDACEDEDEPETDEEAEGDEQ